MATQASPLRTISASSCLHSSFGCVVACAGLKLLQVSTALAAELHCGYLGSDVSMLVSAPIRDFQKDAFHMDEQGHAISAAMDFPVLRDAVLKHRENWLLDSDRGKLRR